MQPYKLVEEEVTHTFPALVPIDYTKWFDFSKKTPGQPGVFEVDAPHQFDGEDSPRRFSYWNGVQFGPVTSAPDTAFRARFQNTTRAKDIQSFRGLVEEA